MYAALPKRILLATLLAVFCLSPSCRADEATDDFNLGVSLYRKARYQLAADTFDEFLKTHAQHPRAALAQLYYGLSLHSLEQYDSARKQFLLYIEANPTSPHLADARYRTGESSFYLGDYNAAVTQLSEYLKLHSGHELNNWATLFLGESYTGTGEFAEAETTLRGLLESSPEIQLLPETQFELGRALEAQGKTQDALELFQKLADQKGGIFTARSLAHIGTIHFQAKDFAKASAAYDTIVADFPGQPITSKAALQSGAAQFALGNYRDALAKLENVPAAAPETKEAGLLKGLCLRELGELDSARKLLQDAYAKAAETPQAAEILYRRAELERFDDKKDVAAQMFIDLADRWPEDPRAAGSLFNAAEAKMELGDFAAATALLKRLESDSPGFSTFEVQILQGRMLLAEDKPENAVAILRTATETKGLTAGQDLLASYHLIRAYYRNKQFAEVLETFEPRKTQFQQSPSTGTVQAIALAALSCLETKQFEKAQQLASEFLVIETEPAKQIDALSARSVAFANLKRFDEAMADINTLTVQHSDTAQAWSAVVQSAEAAWRAKEYAAAAGFYKVAADHKVDPRVAESGMAGLAWSQFELGNFDVAVVTFQALVDAFPNSRGLNEAEYMVAFCQDKSGQEIDAARGFLALFDRLEPTLAEKQPGHPDLRFASDSGRAFSRLAAKNNQLDAANNAYERMTKSFPASADMAAIYDEWAYLNYSNKQYEKSDAIYELLLEKFPKSEFAGSARLTLAESAMVADRLDDALAEFKAISTSADYVDAVKEPALVHAIDILSAKRQWIEVMELSKTFADKYGASDRAPRVQLFFAQALLDQKDFAEADRNVQLLKKGVIEGLIPDAEWTDRIWVVEADIALAEKRYADIDKITDDFLQRKPKSKFAFQLSQIQGLRWKTQAEPDFVRARQYFKQVTQDEFGRGTETAARCQFLIAETLLLQKQLKQAVIEYYQVYRYPYPDWQARGLYQMAMCEEALGDQAGWTRTLTDLVKEFPNHELATQAKQKLAQPTNSP